MKELDKYFEAFNKARTTLVNCSNTIYKKELPFSDETGAILSGLLDQMDTLYARLNSEATEWVEENETNG